jgi:hypothetical protein
MSPTLDIPPNISDLNVILAARSPIAPSPNCFTILVQLTYAFPGTLYPSAL